MFLVLNRHIVNMPFLRLFLGDTIPFYGKRKSIQGVIGWGHKPTADKARRYAARNNLPYIALEDGFLRSLDLGCKGAQPALSGSGSYGHLLRCRRAVRPGEPSQCFRVGNAGADGFRPARHAGHHSA